MKTVMQMMENGNYDSVVLPIQHDCSKGHWNCRQYAQSMDKLTLECEEGDPYEDGFSVELDVNFCPFCGFSVKP